MKVKIGLAMIDKSRCLPHAHATPCIVCEEVCPTPKKAVWFEKAIVKDRQGREIVIQEPRIDLELCIGCEICEAKCPEKTVRQSMLRTSENQDQKKEDCFFRYD